MTVFFAAPLAGPPMLIPLPLFPEITLPSVASPLPSPLVPMMLFAAAKLMRIRLRVSVDDEMNRRSIQVSPDGRFLATVALYGDEVHIRDRRTGELVTRIQSSRPIVRFSPDSRMLVITSLRGCSFYDTDSWNVLHETSRQLTRRVQSRVCFSPDGTMIAIQDSSQRNIATLISATSFAELARFEIPADQVIHSLQFSPNGSRLIMSSGQQALIHFWKLRKIRQKLGGVDWALPQLPPPVFDASKRLRVEFEMPAIRIVAFTA